jgi:hypothetical protein
MISTNYPDHEYDYRELVRLTARDVPTFQPLKDFLRDGNDNLPSEITLLEFGEVHGTEKKIKSETIDPKRPEDIKTLEAALKRDDGHQLLLVENLTPTMTSLLGTHWKIPPDFFLAHLENSNWYSMQNIPQNLPGLSSVQSLDKFVRLQFVGPREIEISDTPKSQSGGNVIPSHTPKMTSPIMFPTMTIKSI